MEQLTIVKIGGKIIEEENSLSDFLKVFSQIKEYKILVHGGGHSATRLAERLGIENNIVDGRRITDAATLELLTMVYGGLVNKNIVVKLQALSMNALGLTGADLNCILSKKRTRGDVDYGYVGDIEKIDAGLFREMVLKNIVPVIAPLTHDKTGNLLNTNADTIASEMAQSLSSYFDVKLVYCLEKKGVMLDESDEDSVIPYLDKNKFYELAQKGVFKEGMLPKLENAFRSVENGVKEVVICQTPDGRANCGTIIKQE